MSKIIVKEDGSMFIEENGIERPFEPSKINNVQKENLIALQGSMVMDVLLKQSELEQKIDAIGMMLVPEIPEV